MIDRNKLNYLIMCLQEEMPEYSSYEMPEDDSQAFALFRALCNVRMPKGHTLPSLFYETEAEVLQSITKEKGITDCMSLEPSDKDGRLFLWKGDITTLKADAIVNAANSQMLGCFQPLHGCIDNMIHTMAGVELREKCMTIMKAQGHEEPVGKAKITPGYNLPARYVIHTVGPMVGWSLTSENRQALSDCYTSCLNLADLNHLQSIAFCCISTGVFRFPNDKAAQIAVYTAGKWLDQHPASSIQRVIFNVFRDIDLNLYQKLLSD